MNSKRKGSAGERELCEYLTAAGYPAHRNDQQYTGGRGNPDVDAAGLERLHIEVKRVEKLNISAAMQQAEHDAENRIPVVIHRRSREKWLITMKLSDFLQGAADGKEETPRRIIPGNAGTGIDRISKESHGRQYAGGKNLP